MIDRTSNRAWDVGPVLAFLPCATPEEWVATAVTDLDLLLLDHAHCERKAAEAAMGLIHRNPTHASLIGQLSRLVREEMRHFEQVLRLIERRGGRFVGLAASRYARRLHREIRTDARGRLVDQLLVGAYIEARSCERFHRLVPALEVAGEGELARFYRGLLAAEARHFEQYLGYARHLDPEGVDARVAELAEIESELVRSPDTELRFHSGPLG